MPEEYDLGNGMTAIRTDGKWIINEAEGYYKIPLVLTDDQMERLIKAKGE